MINIVAEPRAETDFVFLGDHASGWVVQVGEISSMEVVGNYTQMTVRDSQKKILVRRSLTACERQLNPKVFLRANRECLVNLNYVQQVRIHDAKRLLFVLKNGKEIILSRLASLALRRNFSL